MRPSICLANGTAYPLRASTLDVLLLFVERGDAGLVRDLFGGLEFRVAVGGVPRVHLAVVF
jgi:hypothetical protein